MNRMNPAHGVRFIQTAQSSRTEVKSEPLEARTLLAGMPTDLPSPVSRIDTGSFFFVSFGNGFVSFSPSRTPSPVKPIGDVPPIGEIAPLDDLFPVRRQLGEVVGPTATILTPQTGTIVQPGQQVTFSGEAVTATGQPIASANLVWRVTLHDRGTSRALIQPIRGVPQGSFLVPSLPNISGNAFIRITLSASDATGTDVDEVILLPRTAGNSVGQNPPRAFITFISPSEVFRNGETIQFGGSGVDLDEGLLPESRLTWRAAVHRDGRSRAIIEPIRGVGSGSFQVPVNLAPLDSDDFLRLTLTATDSTGRRGRASVDLFAATPIDDGNGGGDSDGDRPDAQIIFPLEGDTVREGQRVRFFGRGIDREDGALGARQFVWRAVLHDGDRRTLITQSVLRTQGGSFVVPENLRAVGDDAFIRLTLTVIDSDGNRGRESVDLNVAADGTGGLGEAPQATIVLPGENTKYAAGDAINFSGNAIDADDGVLGVNRFEWLVTLHRQGQRTRTLRRVVGARAGTFEIPRNIPSDPGQFVRVALTVTDSDGRTTTVTRRLEPRTSTVRVNSNFPDVELTTRVGGRTRVLPFEMDAVLGSRVRVSAPQRQTVDGTTYEFVRWSDNGARAHGVRAGVAGTTLTAFYRVVEVEG